MISDLRLHTKIVTGGFILTTLLTVLFFNGWVLSTTLPRFTYMVVAALILSVVSALLVVNDLVAG